MKDQIKEAFEQVRADGALKTRTKAFIRQKTRGYTRAPAVNLRRLASVLACMALLLAGGRWFYFTPTVAISIDINPSVELGVNRLNRVVSVEGYNDDGWALVRAIDVKYMDCFDAVTRIVHSEDVASRLEDGQIMTIAVVGEQGGQSEQILSGIRSCTAGTDNAYCYAMRPEEVETAHEAGMSYGKYKAYLELRALDPTMTAEEIQGMTMREIRERIRLLSGGAPNGGRHSGNGR